MDEALPLLDPAFELASLFNAEVHITLFTDKDDGGALDYISDDRIITRAETKLKGQHKQVLIKKNICWVEISKTVSMNILPKTALTCWP